MTTLNRHAMEFFVSLAIVVVGITTAPMTFDEPTHVGTVRNLIAGTRSVNPEHPPSRAHWLRWVFLHSPSG